MAWHRKGNMPLSEPMIVKFTDPCIYIYIYTYTYICASCSLRGSRTESGHNEYDLYSFLLNNVHFPGSILTYLHHLSLILCNHYEYPWICLTAYILEDTFFWLMKCNIIVTCISWLGLLPKSVPEPLLTSHQCSLVALTLEQSIII